MHVTFRILVSDMSAFKAGQPTRIVHDIVRHSVLITASISQVRMELDPAHLPTVTLLPPASR